MTLSRLSAQTSCSTAGTAIRTTFDDRQAVREGRIRSSKEAGSLLRDLRTAAVAPSLIIAITIISLAAPMSVHLASLLVAVPVSTAVFAGPWHHGAVALLAVAAGVAIDISDGLLRSPILLIHVLAILVVAAFVTAIRSVHDRARRELGEVRAVSEAAQRVILRPLPSRIGDAVRVASVYRAAEAQAAIGGDLYAAARTSDATRLIIGDVRGKGLPSIDDAAALLGAFREAAYRHATLPELTASLESSVRRHLAEAAGSDRNAAERFITALILEIPDDCREVRIVSCGHPPALLSRSGKGITLNATQPSPPLGLAYVSPADYQQDTFDIAPGDTLLLHTDGLIEARDATGAFYPVSERLPVLACNSPDDLLQRILDDLMVHVGRCPDDDIAMVALQCG
ncbi:PP2C family protein-serine/threonine phosphatase [Streptomyces sp. NPDC054919]